MSYNEQLQRIVKTYEDAGNPLPATAHDIAIWAKRALRDVNVGLIDLYWKTGEIISRKIEAAEMGRQRGG
jgi:hypothetical protein